MRVREAALLGFLLGVSMSWMSKQSDPLTRIIIAITSVTTILAALTIIYGKKILKGPWGGLLTGLVVGIGFGSLLSQSLN